MEARQNRRGGNAVSQDWTQVVVEGNRMSLGDTEES